MTIQIDDVPSRVCQLLFIRHAWDLTPDAAIPALDPVPDVGASSLPASADRAEWEARWHRAWARIWDWSRFEDRNPQEPASEALRPRDRPLPGPRLMGPPSWAAEYGQDGIDLEAFQNWKRRLRPDRRTPAGDEPERLCVAKLVLAWRAGLQAIVLVPYQGPYSEAVGPRHLAVSAATRNDPDRYGEALASFANTGGVHNRI